MKEFNFYSLKLVKEKTVPYPQMQSAEDVGKFFQDMFAFNAEEIFAVAGCNSQGRPVCFFEVSHGDVCSAIVDPAAIFRRLLASNCSAFFVCHNHPSDSLDFSREDIASMNRIDECGKLLNIQLLDSFLVTSIGWTSARRLGYL